MDIISILTASGVVTLLTMVLAIIITMVDKVVNNYGEVTININNSKNFKLNGGSTLLSSLSQQKVFIPSACGGKGACGACKCQVTSDIGEPLPTELPWLTEAEKKDHVRLACQVKVKTNMSIKIPEELLSVQEFMTTIEKIEDLTHDIKRVYARIEGGTIDFIGGQYAQIVIPKYTWKDVIKNAGLEKAEKFKQLALAHNKRFKHDEKEGIPEALKTKGEVNNPDELQRAYSMSGDAKDNHHIEMMIRLVPGGSATTYVHTILKEQQKIKFVGPFGDFYARDTRATMLCVAGGSGMAPIKAILHEMEVKGEREREIWYFFGAVTKADLFYVKELQELEKRMPNFKFIPALSGANIPETEWTGERGFVTDVLDKYIKTKIVKPEAGYEGYLCGSAGMIDACVKVMITNGLTEDCIHYDKF